jgi:NADPH-dependent curcumin reductase CurA
VPDNGRSRAAKHRHNRRTAKPRIVRQRIPNNISGAIHDAVLRHLNLHARIAICGTAAYLTWAPWNEGPRPERHLLVKRATMQGFLTTDFAARYEEAVSALASWVRAGSLKYREDVQEGIESAPGSIAKLYSGENQGKLIIRI